MRIRRWAAILAVLTLMTAACSESAEEPEAVSDAEEEVADESAEDPAAPTADPAAEEPTEMAESTEADAPAGDGATLRWRTRPDNQAEAEVYADISNQIEGDLEGITLEYEAGGSESSSYQDVLKTELSSGTAPDVFWIPGTDIADFASRGLILDLREMAESSDAYAGDDAYFEGPMEFLTFDPESEESGSALWGLPRDVSTFALYLNLDLIEQAGVPSPIELSDNGEWTWEAFRQVAEAVSAVDDQTFGFGMNAWWANYGFWINSAGGNFFTEDRTGCAVDSDEAITGLEFMQGLYQDELAVPFGEDAEPPFLAGQVGMFMNGRWATPGTRASADFDWDVAKLPEGPGGPSNWLFWGAYVVNAETANPDEAFRLVTQLTSPETQLAVAELGANIPSRTDDEEALDQFLTFTPPENTAAFLDGLQENPVAEGPLWQGDWPGFDGALGPEVNSLLAGDQTLEDFQGSICDQLGQYFDA